MTAPKNPNEPRVVPVREFVKTADEPVEVQGTVTKAGDVGEVLAKTARKARKKRKEA